MLFCRIRLSDDCGPTTATPTAFDVITLPAPVAPTVVFGAFSMFTPTPALPRSASPAASVPTRLPFRMFPDALLPGVPSLAPPQKSAVPQIAMPANPLLPETTLPTIELPGARLM